MRNIIQKFKAQSNNKFFIREIFLLLSLWIILMIFSIQGIDLTDTGYHVTLQYELIDNFQSSIFSDSRFVLLTNFFGGLWLHIYPQPSLIWVYIGGSLMCSVTALFTYKILILLFPNFSCNYLWWITFASSLYISSLNSRYIHYYNFPSLLVIISLYLIIHIFFIKKGGKEQIVYSFLFGFFLFLIIASKISLFFTMVTLFLFFLIFNKEKNKKIIIISIYGFLGGFFVLLVSLLLNKISLSELIISYFPRDIGETHNFITLLENIIPDLLVISKYLLFFLICFYFSKFFLVNRISRKKYLIIAISFISIIIILQILYEFNNFNWYSESIYIIMGIILMMGLMKCNITKYLNIRDINSDAKYINQITKNNINLFFLLTILLILTNTFGSYTGLAKIHYSFWLPLPITIIFIGFYYLNFYDQYERNIFKILIIILIILALFTLTTYVYHDRPREQLSESFSYPSLSFIYSNPQKVKAIDELLFEMQSINASGETVLCINSIPLIYYLSRTHPAYSENPWPILRSSTGIHRWQKKIEFEKNLPKYFILAKPLPYTLDWKENIYNDYSINNIIQIRAHYLNKLNYTALWENSGFIIYQKPNLL